MNALAELLQLPFTHRLGWTLLHSLWQGALVAMMYALARFVLRRRAANARYLAGCFALLTLLAVPLATLLRSPSVTSPAPENAFSVAGAGAMLPEPAASRSPGSSLPGLNLPGGNFLEPIVPWLVAAWVAGVAVLSLRLLQGCWSVRRLRTRGVEPLDAVWGQRLERLKDRLRISRPVQLFKSALVEVPTVIGWLRPVVLLPASSLLGLTPAQLEAILAHELAHISRHDYLVNAFQSVVETLLFYHPAVWWISRCIREDREHCCDDRVVEVCGNRVVYARALAALEELRSPMPGLAFAASGGSLPARIRRLLGLPAETGPAGGREFAGLALLGIGLALVVAGICLMVAPLRYEAVARIRVLLNRPDLEMGNPYPQSSAQYFPYLLQTESEIILSKPMLNRVADALQLKEVWGARHPSSRPLTDAEVLTRLKRRVGAHPVYNTSLIVIRASSDSADEAAGIANAIVDTYRARSLEQLRQQTLNGIKALEEQWKEQIAQVNEAQADVDKLRTELQIADRDPSSPAPPSIWSDETIRQLEGNLVSLEFEAIKQEKQLASLKELDTQALPQAIQTVIGPDAYLGNLLEGLNVAGQKVISLERDFSAESPSVQNAKKLVDDLRGKVRDRVRGILLGLQARLDATRSSVAQLRRKLEEARQADLKSAEQARPYYAAKDKLEERRQFRTALAMKISQQQADLVLPRKAPVEIVEAAVPPLQPVSPNRPRAAASIGLGLLCSGLGVITLRPRAAV